MSNPTVICQSRAVFNAQKKMCLAGIDSSRKGSIDEAIVDFIVFINTLCDYFTLSSCSGRVYVFEESSKAVKKKECKWLYTTHDQCDANHVLESLRQSCGDASLKYEAFIMHVQCCNLQAAQTLHSAAVMAGFRNSGISFSKKGKIVVAVRSTHSLEVPLTHDGVLLVSEQYIHHICVLANERMKENCRRIKRFFEAFTAAVDSAGSSVSKLTNSKGTNRVAECHPNLYDSSQSMTTSACFSDKPNADSIVVEENLTELFKGDTN